MLAMKGSVCWSPSTAPAPRTVLAVLRRTGRGDERVRHLPAREGMPQLHGEDRLERADGSRPQEPADGDESSPLPPRRRCSAIARFWVSRTARSLCCSAASTWRGHAHECWPCPRHENDRGRAARFGASHAPSSTARSERFVPVSCTPLVELPSLFKIIVNTPHSLTP